MLKRNKLFNSETELAERVVNWLKEQGWEVYQEVTYETVADIVAVKNNKVWAIECKLSFGLQILAQAWNWVELANYVSIAVPNISHKSSTYYFVQELFTLLKIGVLTVGNEVYEFRSAPELPKNKLLEHLHKEQKDWAKAGNNKGDRYTPFKHTLRQIEDYLKLHPGTPIKEIIKNIKHHYSNDNNACSAIRQWINKGIITTIDVEQKGRKFLYYYRK